MRVLALVVVLGGSYGASAGPCPTSPETNALATLDGEERIAFLTQELVAERRRVNIWSWSWGGVYMGATVAQGVVAGLSNNRSDRIDLIVNGSSSLVAGSLVLFMPLPFMSAVGHFEHVTAKAADRCQVLAEAEHLLLEGLAYEQLQRGWLAHLANVLINTGFALILGVGFHHWEAAGISGGVGIALGLGQIFSHPANLQGALETYRAGKLRSGAEARVSWGVAPFGARGGGGFSAGMAF